MLKVKFENTKGKVEPMLKYKAKRNAKLLAIKSLFNTFIRLLDCLQLS